MPFDYWFSDRVKLMNGSALETKQITLKWKNNIKKQHFEIAIFEQFSGTSRKKK